MNKVRDENGNLAQVELELINLTVGKVRLADLSDDARKLHAERHHEAILREAEQRGLEDAYPIPRGHKADSADWADLLHRLWYPTIDPATDNEHNRELARHYWRGYAIGSLKPGAEIALGNDADVTRPDGKTETWHLGTRSAFLQHAVRNDEKGVDVARNNPDGFRWYFVPLWAVDI